MRPGWLVVVALLAFMLAGCGTLEIRIETKVAPPALSPSATLPRATLAQPTNRPSATPAPSATPSAPAATNPSAVPPATPTPKSTTASPATQSPTPEPPTPAPTTTAAAPLPSATHCPPWFFDPPPAACAAAPAEQREGAAQRFERGFILWTAAPDQFLVFLRDSRSYLIIAAPYTNAEGEVVAATPPPGMQAPVSGFGMVWRGEIAAGNTNFDALPAQLGWAVEAERVFATDFQCAVAANRAEERCYLRDPGGAIVSITPYGAWAYVGE